MVGLIEPMAFLVHLNSTVPQSTVHSSEAFICPLQYIRLTVENIKYTPILAVVS